MTTVKVLDTLADQLDQLRQRDAISDRTIAEAIRSVGVRQQVPAPLSADPAQVDLIFRLAWWIYVRAAALDARYLLVGPMSLDLVIREERSLQEVLDELRHLERTRELGDDKLASKLGVDAQLKVFRQHAKLVERVATLGVRDLHKPIEKSMESLRANQESFGKLYAALTDEFIGEFDALARSGAFTQAMHGQQEEDGHAHHHEDDGAPLESAEAYLERAEQRFSRGDLHGAISDSDAALELDEKCLDAYLQRGIARAAHDQVDEAIADFDRALELEPTHVAALLNRALAYYAQQSFMQAIVDLDLAAQTDPDSPEVFTNRGIVRCVLKDYSGARADFDRAIELDPTSVVAYSNRAMVHRARGDLREAILDYQKATELDPNYAEAWSALGFIYLSSEYFGEAITYLGHAIKLQPYAGEHYYNRANAQVGLERYDKAIEDYGKAIELDAEDVQSYLNRGLARLKNHDFNGAIDDWNRAIEIDPYNPMPYAKRAGVWNLLDQPAEAAQDLHHALDLAPDDWEYADFARQMLADIGEELGYARDKKD